MQIIPTISIIGRPNTGKSTLFNRITKSKKSIIENIAGVTRDRLYSEATWEGKKFVVIDTGGLENESDITIRQTIAKQVKIAISESDLIIMVADVKSGLIPDDKEILDYLRTTEKPYILAVNKVDGPKQELAASEFYETGIEEIHTISATHGIGVGDLLDAVFEKLEFTENFNPLADETNPKGIRITFLGRPNVGKSSIINKILRKDRLLVDDVAGTTVDAVEVPFVFNEEKFVLVDTAGMRRKRSIKQNLEQLAIAKSVSAIYSADVVVLVLDALLGVHEQDAKLASLAVSKGRGIIIALNKWDLLKTEEQRTVAIQGVKDKLRFLDWSPVIRISAKTGKNINKLFIETKKIYESWSKRIPTSQLNKFLEETTEAHHAPWRGKRPLRFYYMTQPETKPPLFLIYSNKPKTVPESYRRYIVNKLREDFDFQGTPIKLILRASHEKN